MPAATVFVTGATGYMGRSLIPLLVRRGHRVLGLVRSGSEARLPKECEAVSGNALSAATFASKIPEGATLLHLVGVAHPNPSKAREFREIDLVSVQASVAAAREAGVRHFIYLSVAQPAPMMKAYIAVRQEGEMAIRSLNIPATFLRPWYVLGPGHRWPYLLVPIYKIAELFPPTRPGALRLGLVTLRQMTAALVHAVEHPPDAVRIIEAPEIRQLGKI